MAADPNTNPFGSGLNYRSLDQPSVATPNPATGHNNGLLANTQPHRRPSALDLGDERHLGGVGPQPGPHRRRDGQQLRPQRDQSSLDSDSTSREEPPLRRKDARPRQPAAGSKAGTVNSLSNTRGLTLPVAVTASAASIAAIGKLNQLLVNINISNNTVIKNQVGGFWNGYSGSYGPWWSALGSYYGTLYQPSLVAAYDDYAPYGFDGGYDYPVTACESLGTAMYTPAMYWMCNYYSDPTYYTADYGQGDGAASLASTDPGPAGGDVQPFVYANDYFPTDALARLAQEVSGDAGRFAAFRDPLDHPDRPDPGPGQRAGRRLGLALQRCHRDQQLRQSPGRRGLQARRDHRGQARRRYRHDRHPAPLHRDPRHDLGRGYPVCSSRPRPRRPTTTSMPSKSGRTLAWPIWATPRPWRWPILRPTIAEKIGTPHSKGKEPRPAKASRAARLGPGSAPWTGWPQSLSR